MTRYWVIAPYTADEPDIFEKVWKYDLENKVISIGWRKLGDVTGLDGAALQERINKEYREEGRNLNYSFKTVQNFYHNIKEGNIVIARKGTKKIAAIGTVTKTAYYSKEKGIEQSGKPEWYFPHFIGVEWHDSPRDLEFNKIVFSINTLYEITEDKYKSILAGEKVKELGEEVEKESPLEKDLEDFIVSNFDKIFKGKLILYRDPGTGEIAQQYSTDVGRIDILAQERGSNSFVVVELKKDQEADKVVGQTLRYMGWVKENLCEDDQGVKGLIICKEADDKLRFALKMVNNIDLKYYSVSFELFDKG